MNQIDEHINRERPQLILVVLKRPYSVPMIDESLNNHTEALIGHLTIIYNHFLNLVSWIHRFGRTIKEILQSEALVVVYVGILKDEDVVDDLDELWERHFEVFVAVVVVFFHVEAILCSIGFIIDFPLLFGLIKNLFLFLLEPHHSIIFDLIIKLQLVNIFRP